MQRGRCSDGGAEMSASRDDAWCSGLSKCVYVSCPRLASRSAGGRGRRRFATPPPGDHCAWRDTGRSKIYDMFSSQLYPTSCGKFETLDHEVYVSDILHCGLSPLPPLQTSKIRQLSTSL